MHVLDRAVVTFLCVPGRRLSLWRGGAEGTAS